MSPGKLVKQTVFYPSYGYIYSTVFVELVLPKSLVHFSLKGTMHN